MNKSEKLDQVLDDVRGYIIIRKWEYDEVKDHECSLPKTNDFHYHDIIQCTFCGKQHILSYDSGSYGGGTYWRRKFWKRKKVNK